MRSQGKKLAALARAIAAQPKPQTAQNDADKNNPLVAAILAAQQAAPPVVLYLWPECVDDWAHWCAVQTQWKYSAGGTPIGLDYAGVRAYLECGTELQGAALCDTFAAIRAAERGHLEGMAERDKLEGRG